MKRLGAVLVLLLLVVLPVFAQGGPKRGDLIRADYGAGNQWVDVTQRVRSLIRGESLNFRVDNNALGVDPSPGQAKALRLQFRAKNGRTRQLTFQENQYVNLRVNATQYAGGGSGGLQILRADYGAGSRFSDVTARLNSQIRGDQLDLQVTNDTMGGDPVVGQEKILRVQYAYNGRQGQVDINEGNYIRLPDGSATYQDRLQITRAQYGSGNRMSDVTARLNSQIRGNQLSLQVTNDTMGGDPAVGQEKTLRVEYTYNGRQGQVAINEGNYIRLPDGSASNQGGLQILRADYGAGSRFSDVTARLNSQIQGDQLNLRVTNDTMGGDPAVGQDKVLRVQYIFNGRSAQASVNEGSYLSLPGGGSYTGANNYNDGTLQITRAQYGVGNRFSDVTSRLNSQIRGNQLNLQVTNDTMGGDPAVGQDKILRVQYAYNGRQGQVDINEGNYIRLPDGSATYQDRLQITRAQYGAGNRLADVTARLNSQIQGDQLNLQVTNDTMGGDPSPNQVKTLTVRYTYNGQSAQSVVNEGGYLSLPGGGSYTGARDYNDGTLQITRAVYGSGNRMSDVTGRLNSQIQGGQLSLQVTNDTMGGDPAVGQNKTLTVQYTYNGRSAQASVNEGSYLSLPGGGSYTTGARDYNDGTLQISRAQYGSGNHYSDVTARLNSEIRGNQLNLQVTNDTMGGDPAVGQDKTLRVEYIYNGRQGQVTVREGDYLRLSPNALTGSSDYGAYRVIPSGTQLAIRTNEVIDSATSAVGQKFSAVMYADVPDSSGAVVIPRGSDVELVIRSTAGSDLVLDIDSLVVAGQRYVVSTGDLEQKGGQGIGANRRTAVMVGGGAAAGAIIGAILGGGKGAAIGAGVGAAGGAGVEFLTKGKEVKVPAETILNFRLDTDLRLQP